MPRSIGFPPVAGRAARVLILGSMPGRVSLEKREYYAQPRNSFWRIMGELFGAGAELPYRDRLNVLVAQRVALWDVLRSCDRQGSLDSGIGMATAVANNFGRFFREHRSIGYVFFNGTAAAGLFHRRVIPAMGKRLDGVSLVTLPSTSPANATLRPEEKARAWRAVRRALVLR